MGIRGLTTFIKDDELCPGGILQVNISDKVKEAISVSGKNDASLAIYTNSCVGRWYVEATETQDGICGGQWMQYQMRLRKLITDCEKLSLNLHFFFRGMDIKVQSNKKI
ncbi:unnamed protein product, partial [Meganyctiphanes norvegica]